MPITSAKKAAASAAWGSAAVAAGWPAGWGKGAGADGGGPALRVAESLDGWVAQTASPAAGAPPPGQDE
jgi:hypothetical protein